MKAARALLAALAIIASPGRAEDRPGDFDFYVLALSWSPTWCATDGRGSASPQCGAGAGRGFVLHGLWPQHETGWPESCYQGHAPWVADEIAAAMADIMPDRELVFGEWRKHGTCSGLSPADYFATSRDAHDRIVVPPAFAPPGGRTISASEAEQSFIAVNPGLMAGGIAIACADGLLTEVRICLTRTLGFRSCAEVDRRGCRQKQLELPAAE
jgi:ribonuclease T2